MATFSSSGWPAGATVSVYVKPTVPGVTALGSAVTSDTASSAGVADFTGLTTNQDYVASDGTTRKHFKIAASFNDVGWSSDAASRPGGYGIVIFTTAADPAAVSQDHDIWVPEA